MRFDNGRVWHKSYLSALYIRASTFFEDKEFYANTGADVILAGKFRAPLPPLPH